MCSATRRRALVLAILTMWPLAVATADTPKPTKERCIDANTRAQTLRRSADFSSAREQLKICIDSRCPRIVRDDCLARLDELERAQPTLVFDAKSPDGEDLSAVEVRVDGRPWATKLDGTALAIDPGQHTFTFDGAGQPPVTRQLVVREGEKGRHEAVVIGTPKAPASTPEPVLPVAPPAVPAESSSFSGRPIGVVLGGVGLTGIAVGSIFGLLTKSAVDRRNQDCPSPSTCDDAAANSDHKQAVRDGTIADIGFIAGGALLAGGVTLFFLSAPRPRGANEPTTGWVVVPAAGPSGGGLSLQGLF